MDDELKSMIANELFFIGKLFVIGIIFWLITFLFSESWEWKYFGGDLINVTKAGLPMGLVFVGIGYAIRLIKWVFKWKG